MLVEVRRGRERRGKKVKGGTQPLGGAGKEEKQNNKEREGKYRGHGERRKREKKKKEEERKKLENAGNGARGREVQRP